jgi:hypothetical protein
MQFLLTAVLALMAFSQAAPAPPSVPVPVVVELFTSEGCSSCPPADTVLSQLAKQSVAGVQVIPLGMHVTYWDQLGWKDPASLALATERQQDYGRVFGGDRIYTPQAVVDGREELVGSDGDGVRRAIQKAARQPHVRVDLRASLDGDSLKAEAAIGDLPPDIREKLEARMVITEDGLTSVVKRGENGGRTLRHDAAVRAMFGSDVAAARLLGFRATLRPEWQRERLHVIVLLQGRNTRHIVGAAQTAIK